MVTLAVIGVLAAAQSAQAVAPRAGFQDELVATVGNPTALAFTADDTMLVTSLTGQLTAVRTNGSKFQVGDLSSVVCIGGENGLYGIAIDPEFALNRHIYLTYSRKRPDVDCDALPRPANRVSRFKLNLDLSLDTSSETVLVDELASPARSHNAGDIEFGKDGYLYVTTGDGNCELVNTRCGQANPSAGRRNVLLGKILRITREGGVPPDNPFTGPGTVRCNAGPAPAGFTCQEIWALGLRNPFRFAMDPDAAGVRLFINDVGLARWEEVNEGRAGADYGWPVREGPCLQGSYTNCPPPGPYTNPTFSYRHDSSNPKCSGITGGAFVPAAAWPPPYAGSYLYADYVCGNIFRLSRKSNKWVREVFVADVWLPIHLEFGPAPGDRPALYYTTLREQGGAIHRLRFLGAGNRPPAADLQASATDGPLPLDVTFDASRSTDADGDTLTYEFDFGDGTPVQVGSDATVTHTYTTQGHYTASVTVRDPVGLTSRREVRIDAGYLAPAVSIVDPASDFRFAVAEPFELRAVATDPEDGQLPASAISWTVLLHHDQHTHPYAGPVTGSTLEIDGPRPEGVAAMKTSYLEVYVTATDSDGVSRTAFRRLDARTVVVSLLSNLSSTPITVNGARFVTPATIAVWAGWELRLAAAPNHMLQTFRNWHDGVRTNPRTVRPDRNTHFKAFYSLL